MLQRASSNAYSWWWASHIRTKQSKWLEQSLQDMEEKVANAMNLVQKDGDSFAKRAEMYYKHRPELIAFIEESVRAYRALAERYDKLSTDLQKANTTIASVFPDQLPYDTGYDDNGNDNDNDNDDENNSWPKISRNAGPDPPKAPKVPATMKTFLTNSPNKHLIKNATKEHNDNHSKGVLKSGLTKEEATDEIDKLQKGILSIQTVKEFTKSSYESGFAKFLEIENKIIEMQQRVCDLQDEFKVVKDIEDDDARVIMAEAALKSCQENLAKLQAKHDESRHKVRLERERIQNVKQKLESFKHEHLQFSDDNHHDEHESEHNELQEKIKENIEELSKKRLTVTEMADMIDKLVNTVIGLEMLVSSQSALIERLTTEADDLHIQIQNLEQDKGVKTYKDVEKKLEGVQDLGINIENQNNKLSLHFTEAHCNVHHLFDKIYDLVKPDEELVNDDVANNMTTSETTYNKQTNLPSKIPLIEEQLVQSREHTNNGNHVKRDEEHTNDGVANDMITSETTYAKQNNVPNRIPLIAELLVGSGEVGIETNVSTKPGDIKPAPKDLETTFDVLKASEPQVETNWQELLSGGLDDKQKVLLQEYTTILRKYKTAKKELVEEEQKNQKRVGEMKKLLAKQDYEIEQMKQKLNLLQETDEEQVVNIKPIFIDNPDPVSETEAKLRANIDTILDENLDFWLRFSSTFHQVQKFKTEVEDLQQEITKVKAKGSDGKTSIRSEINAIFKHLKEIQTELTIWLDQSAILKNELQRRFESLFDIQEDIKRALREGVEEDEIKFNTHQAAKFQGEVSNMQQENTKVNQELEAGLSHVAALQVETEETLKRLEDEFGLSYQKQPRSPNRPHVPLRSFIFGVKSKKQKPSILGCINPHKKLTASSFL
ncbi:protein NETWORKED 2C-like [Bidens hawaiensis]|uniref:protein NETWORKED 2C-like n=1 Tax=Bidens hawaiensis TaxID=980011 RepID=UPI0040494E5A